MGAKVGVDLQWPSGRLAVSRQPARQIVVHQRLEPLLELILECHRAALHQGGPDHVALMGRQCD